MNNRILLIEDNQDMADNISSILTLAHYDVIYAQNGKVGVDLAQRYLPDLILCDIMMPELDGYGVLQILNNDEETADIPFIFLTAKTDTGDVRSGMNLGADDYITKPFDGYDLLKVLEIRLKKKQMQRASRSNNLYNSHAFFSQAREQKEFEKLYENRPKRMFKRKEFIFIEGQTPTDLYYILTGEVKTYKINKDGKELITGLHHAGNFVGYVSLFDEKPHHENAEILEEAEIMMISREDFLSLIYSSRDVARRFIKLLSARLSDAENRLLDLAYQSVRQRVAGALLAISREFDSTTIAIARKDISNLIGTATESLNRTLADFKEEELIEIDMEGIRICDKGKLQRLLH